VVDFAMVAVDFIAQECVVKSMKVLGVCFEEGFGNLIEQGNEEFFGDGFLVLKGFGLLDFGINLGENVMKMAKCETVAEDTAIEHEHHELGVLEKIGIGFGKIRNQLVDALNFSLFELELFLLHTTIGL
jgi:hypothetical protein